MMKHMAKKPLTPGPRDERGVLQARILAAARAAFAETGWAGTTIRAIARAAEVDPALIYHYFGSKERLLDAATNPPQKWLEAVAESWTTPVPDLGRELLKLMMDSWADQEIGPVLRATILTAAHEPTTRAKLRLIVERSLMGASQLGADDQHRRVRSGLISTQIIGLALMRYVWKVEPIATMTEDEILAAVGPNLQRYIEQDLSSPAPTPDDS